MKPCTKGRSIPCSDPESGLRRGQWCCACLGDECEHVSGCRPAPVTDVKPATADERAEWLSLAEEDVSYGGFWGVRVQAIEAALVEAEAARASQTEIELAKAVERIGDSAGRALAERVTKLESQAKLNDLRRRCAVALLDEGEIDAVHEDGCPEDDTCDCPLTPLVHAVLNVDEHVDVAAAEGALAALAAKEPTDV